jgi:glycine/D-amino acid oxidase-like deaminating enzyme
MSSSAEQSHSNAYLPVPNPTDPYWRKSLHRLDSHRSTEILPTKSDVVIIGSGISGVSVAYHLSQPDPGAGEASTPPSILLLEARQVCSGATGRNGGHVKVKARTLLRVSENEGPEYSESLAAYVDAQINALKDVVERERISCEFELRRSYDVFLNQEEAESVRASWARYSSQRTWAKPRQLLDSAVAESVSSVKGAEVAVSSPACSMVSLTSQVEPGGGTTAS